MPKQAVHVARHEYRCDAPYGPCARRILAGRAYTQLAFAPGEKPFKAHGWTYLRACSHCVPLAVTESELPAKAPCSGTAGGLPCLLTAGHYPTTDHQFLEGLF